MNRLRAEDVGYDIASRPKSLSTTSNQDPLVSKPNKLNQILIQFDVDQSNYLNYLIFSITCWSNCKKLQVCQARQNTVPNHRIVLESRKANKNFQT